MNVRLTGALLVMLALIAGTVLITRELSSKEPKEEQPWVWKVSSENLSNISVIHQEEQQNYALVGDSWMIRGEQDIPVFLPKWSGTTLLLSGPRATRDIVPQIDDPAKYGLDSPQTVVTIQSRGGNSLTFHLGDPTPDGQNWYVRLAGQPQLYTVAAVWGEVVTRLALEPPYPPEFRPWLYKLNVEDVNRIAAVWDQIIVEYNLVDGRWLIKGEVADTPVSEEKWADTPALLSEPPSGGVLAEEIDDLSQYGLEPPQGAVIIGASDGAIIEFRLGHPTEDGQHLYAKIGDDDRLYQVSAALGELISGLATDPPYVE